VEAFSPLGVLERYGHTDSWTTSGQGRGGSLDAHRSLANPGEQVCAASEGGGRSPVVDRRFYSTVSMLRTRRTLLRCLREQQTMRLLVDLTVLPGNRVIKPPFVAGRVDSRQSPIFRGQIGQSTGRGAVRENGTFAMRTRGPGKAQTKLILCRTPWAHGPPPAMLCQAFQDETETTTDSMRGGGDAVKTRLRCG